MKKEAFCNIPKGTFIALLIVTGFLFGRAYDNNFYIQTAQPESQVQQLQVELFEQFLSDCLKLTPEKQKSVCKIENQAALTEFERLSSAQKQEVLFMFINNLGEAMEKAIVTEQKHAVFEQLVGKVLGAQDEKEEIE